MNDFHHGVVMVSDGSSQPQPMRAVLKDQELVLQKEEIVYVKPQEYCATNVVDSKGGAEHKLPVLISRIYKDQAADLTRQLYVGDAIIKVNNINIEKYIHDDAVKTLKSAGNHVTLTVRHYQSVTPFLCHNLQNDTQDKQNNYDIQNFPSQSKYFNKLEKKWTDVITLPLLMAYITRYIAGTDKLRLNSFEVSNHNSMFMAVIHCNDPLILDDWVKRISNRIEQLNSEHVISLNKKFVANDAILYMTWVEEAKFSQRHPWCSWRSRFLALKGGDALLFDSPPVTLRSWLRPETTFKVHQTMLKVLQESECQDNRPNCFLLQNCEGSARYFSVEEKNTLTVVELAWQKMTYTAVTKLGSKTFPAIVFGKSAALTLDWNMGFALYDTEAKSYLWKYRFSYLKGSSDDGNSRLKLHFQDPDKPDMEIKELETPSLQSLLFCIHSFLTAKVVSVDPTFLQKT